MKRIGDVLSTISVPIGPTNRTASPVGPEPTCPRCQDAGWVRLDVPVGHPNFGRVFPCDCKIREQQERSRDSLRRLSNLDAFQQHTFDDFDLVEGTEEAFEAARAYSNDPDGWLFLHGACGVGKTHLAVAAAIQIRQWNSNVLFAVVPDLLDHLRATFDPGRGVAYDERFNAIRGAFLLILDDLGTENTTPWAREKLYQLINHRYNERLPTIITSNQEHKMIDERILSRLLDTHLTRDIKIDALDFRRRSRPDYFRRARR